MGAWRRRDGAVGSRAAIDGFVWLMIFWLMIFSIGSRISEVLRLAANHVAARLTNPCRARTRTWRERSTILSHTAAVHGVNLSVEPIALARIALARLGLVGKRDERERRPTQDEIDRLIAAYDANRFQQIPVGCFIRLAVATAMRQDEICRIGWPDFDPHKRMLIFRDRKDPPRKSGNNQRIRLLDITGYDGCAIIEEQRSCAVSVV
jgi:integrase